MSNPKPPLLAAFQGPVQFSAPIRSGETVTHDVYQLGEGRKIVLLMQELPGIDEATVKLANRLVGRGFRVILPHLVGPIGKQEPLRNMRKVCISMEFHTWAHGESSPIVDWLAALCEELRVEHGVSGVAAIGMCLTGDFAISLMANDAVLAAYASQPSLPFFSFGRRLPFSPQEVEDIKAGLSAKGPMKCARFSSDYLACTGGKFKALDQTFNQDEKRIQMEIIKNGIWPKHSILTGDYDHTPGHPTRVKLEEVIDYFDQTLSDTEA
ncbi:MAG: dienelactone hydrolase family protein [Bacteroidota bacterium]